MKSNKLLLLVLHPCRKRVVALLDLSPDQAAVLRVAHEQFVRVKLNLMGQHQDVSAVMTAATDRRVQQMQAQAARESALQHKHAAAEAFNWPELASISSNMKSMGDLSELSLDLDVDFDLVGLEFDQTCDHGFDQEMLQLPEGAESATAAAASCDISSLQEKASFNAEQTQDAQQQLQLQPDVAAAEVHGESLAYDPADAAAQQQQQEQQQDASPAVAWAGAESAAEERLRGILAGCTVASNMLSFTIISTLSQVQLARMLIGCYPVLPRGAASEYMLSIALLSLLWPATLVLPVCCLCELLASKHLCYLCLSNYVRHSE
jgi:hypothetical protein